MGEGVAATTTEAPALVVPDTVIAPPPATGEMFTRSGAAGGTPWVR
ncbi:MAG TPA: hypothetical protein VE571_01330 [Solirubrobacteraceae bacterium]|nr:hypothetical protein [Solirubrobacteraceae bacterium]